MTSRTGAASTRLEDGKAEFLQSLTTGATIAEATRKVGVGRATVNRRLRADAVFAAEVEAAVAAGANEREVATKFTAEIRAQYLELLVMGGRRGASARLIGVQPSTVRAYAAAHPEFRELRQIAEQEADEIVVDALWISATKDRNVRAIETWLFNRQPQKWRDKRMVGVVGKTDDTPIAVEATVQDKTESTLRIGRALEQTGALGASLAAMLGQFIADTEDGD